MDKTYRWEDDTFAERHATTIFVVAVVCAALFGAAAIGQRIIELLGVFHG